MKRLWTNALGELGVGLGKLIKKIRDAAWKDLLHLRPKVINWICYGVGLDSASQWRLRFFTLWSFESYHMPINRVSFSSQTAPTYISVIHSSISLDIACYSEHIYHCKFMCRLLLWTLNSVIFFWLYPLWLLECLSGINVLTLSNCL